MAHLYFIYHPEGGECNPLCLPNVKYEYVAVVWADDMEDAFRKAQNESKYSKYTDLGIRSTSVGDLIRARGRNAFIVEGKGFKPYQIP